MGYQKSRNVQSKRYARKQARKGLQASYKATKSTTKTAAIHKPATAKQLKLLKELGIKFDAKSFSRAQASTLISNALNKGEIPEKPPRKPLTLEEQLEAIKKIGL